MTPRLSNDEFRNLLMTPGRAGASSLGGMSSRNITPRSDSQKKFKTPQTPKPSKPRVITDSKYKDRAAERRKGLDHDYEEVDELDRSGMTPGSRSQSTKMEQSKVLGGDEETTHKVLGLDYSLLTKSKMKILKEEREMEEKKKEELVVKELENKNNVLSKDGHQIEAPKEFQSRMGKALYNAIFVKQRDPVVEHFLPGRTTFLYDLDIDSHHDLPTTVHRSREVIDHGKQLEFATTHPDILSRITKIMVYYTQGAKAYKKMKKKQKKEKEEAEKAKNPIANLSTKKIVVEDEGGIFDDVDGEYVPSVLVSEPKSQSTYTSFVKRVRDSNDDELANLSNKKQKSSISMEY